jgi:hypothetical protein
MKIHNTDEDPMVDILRRLAALETANPLQAGAIDHGALSILSDEGLIVKGSASVSGILKGIGQLLWSGIVRITGPLFVSDTLDVIADATFQGATTIQNTLDVTAETTLSGATTIKNTLDVEALTRLLADLIISGDGKITVQGLNAVTLGMTSADVPGLEFEEGGAFVGVENGVQLNNAAGNGFVFASADVGLQRGSKSIRVTVDDITLRGPVFMPDLPEISGVSANVTVDPATGELGVI